LLTGGISTNRTCLDSGWCWENGPVGQRLTAVWAAADDDVWAVGADIALHWDGSTWNPTRLPRSPLYFHAVWGSASNDVWAVGPGVAVHWNGSGWSEVALPAGGTFWSVSGTGPSDVWILGVENFDPIRPIALHWEGRSWSSSSLLAYEKIFALSPGDAIAVGSDRCQRWTGSAWRDDPCGVRGANGVWASGENDIWVTGSVTVNEGPNATRFYRAHWDGVSWAREEVPVSSAPSSTGRMFGTARDDVWWGNLHFDGDTWSSASERYIFPAAGVTGGKLWSASGPGISRFDGTEWKLAVASAPDQPKLAGGLRGDDLWVLMASGAILRFDGGCWSTLNGPQPDLWLANHLTFGSSSADIWALGSSSRLHWDGKSWSPARLPPGVQQLQGGWSNGPGDAFVFAVDDAGTRIFHWNGQEWSLHGQFEGERMFTWWGSGSDDLWLGGYWMNGAVAQSRVWRWDGQSWSLADTFDQGTVGAVGQLFGTIRGDVWIMAVSERAPAQLLHWDGKKFVAIIDSPTWLAHGAGSGPDDLWTTGSGLFHLEKSGWAASPFFSPGIYSGVVGTGPVLHGVPGFGLVSASTDGALFLRRR
jgi:hypothetical protein